MLNINITRSITTNLKNKLGLSQDEEAVALYGLQFLVYSFIGYGSILVIGLLIGCFWSTLTVTLASSVLRLFSGGAHCKTPLRCIILGAIIAPLLGKIASLGLSSIQTPAELMLIVAVGFIVSLMINWRLAPVDSPAKPIISAIQRRKLRSLSVISLCFITAIQYLIITHENRHMDIVFSISLGLWWQAFTLTKAGNKFVTILDNILEKEVEKSGASLQ